MAEVDDVKMEMGRQQDDNAATTVKPSGDEDKSFYQKHKVVIWIVVALAVFAVAAAIGVGIAKALEDRPEHYRKVWLEGSCPRDQRSCPSGFDRAPLIIIGLDGFSGDLFDRHVVKHIHKLRECGAHTPNMSSMFPLSTYPNYYSIATGLYPDVHGIIDDYIVDEDFNTEFINGTDSRRVNDKVAAGRFFNGEPIWATARKKHRTSASYLWPGSDLPINEWLPDYYLNSGGHVDYDDRVDQVIEWLKEKKSKRPEMVMLYFNSTQYGDYNHRQNELKKVDEAVGRLMGGLTMLKLRDCANVLLVADWLLVNKTCNPSAFVVEEYVNDRDDGVTLENYQVTPDWLNSMKRLNYTYSPYSSTLLQTVEYENPETTVDRFTCKNVRVKAYTKEELPVRLHYAGTDRIENVILIGEKGYNLRSEDDTATRSKEWLCDGVAPQYFFRNLTSRMLFVGNGYAFKYNFTLASFRSIELYNLMTELLDIEGDPNNGTAGVFRDSLRDPKDLNRTLPWISPRINAVYPSNFAAYEFAISDDEAECKCDEDNGVDIDEYFNPDRTFKYFDDRLNLETQKAELESTHAPFGFPTVFNLSRDQPGNYTLLVNPKYTVAWDNYFKVPKYVSYTIEKQYRRDIGFQIIPRCIRQDVRLIDAYEPRCDVYDYLNFYNLTQGYMVDPEWALTMEEQMDALITTNSVPMYMGFQQGIWSFLNRKYIEWAEEFDGINIVAGPVYDTNHDGKLDRHEDLAEESFWMGETPLPSHFFVVLTRCKGNRMALSQMCNEEDREYLSFILPNVNTIHACQNDDRFKYEYLISHFASLHDIEELTGLRFFPHLTFEEHLRLQMRTPEVFWEDRYYRNNAWE